MATHDDRFWQAGTEVLESDDVTRSTMMGLPCLRIRKKFFAAYNRAGGGLMVKLPAARVAQLIVDGAAEPVAPAGRRFREWAAIPALDADRWPDYLEEARTFVAESAR